MKKEKRLLALGLLLAGLSSVIFFTSMLLGGDLPDAVRRAVGAVDLLAIPVIAYTTVKIAANKPN